MKISLLISFLTICLLPSCSSLDHGYALGYQDGYATGLQEGIHLTKP